MGVFPSHRNDNKKCGHKIKPPRKGVAVTHALCAQVHTVKILMSYEKLKCGPQ